MPGEVKALVEEEEALYAAAPLVGGCCQAQAAPSHLTHLLPDMLSLCIHANKSQGRITLRGHCTIPLMPAVMVSMIGALC